MTYHNKPGKQIHTFPVNTWVQLFKINDVVNYRFVNMSNVNISNMPVFFVEKYVRNFCSAKASLILSTKNISVFGYKVVKHLTN